MAPVMVLVGAPGAGKTTVGRRVATRLGVAFADSDREIEQRAGMSVADIFVDQGEDAFRDLEAKVVSDLLTTCPGVLSLGGGAVLRADSREALAHQRVVWLRVGVPAAASRVGMNTARPLLLGNVRGTLMTLLAERDPLYAEVATVTVDTDGRSIGAVVDAVVQATS